MRPGYQNDHRDEHRTRWINPPHSAITCQQQSSIGTLAAYPWACVLCVPRREVTRPTELMTRSLRWSWAMTRTLGLLLASRRQYSHNRVFSTAKAHKTEGSNHVHVRRRFGTIDYQPSATTMHRMPRLGTWTGRSSSSSALALSI